MDEKQKYVFKKTYTCSMGTINEGREITTFKGMLFIDGGIIPEPYASDMRKLFNDDKFVKEYIRIENIIKNKV